MKRYEHKRWSMKLLRINSCRIVKMYRLTAMIFATILRQIYWKLEYRLLIPNPIR